MLDFSLLAGVSTAALVGTVAWIARLYRERDADHRRIVVLQAGIDDMSDRLFVLSEADARSRRLFHVLGDVVVERSRDGTLVAANAGYDALAQDGVLTTLTAGDAVVDSEGVISAEDCVLAPDGSRRWIAWRHVPVRDADDGLNDVLSIGRDITEAKRSEVLLANARQAAEAASGAKSRFLATVSHEIRTPLNGILGMADLLTDTPLSPEQASYVDAVRLSGQSLLSLIEEVLDFSRIESGRLDLECAPFDLVPLLESAVELLAPKAQGKGLDLATAVAPDVPRRIITDAARLRQVILNLVGNAVKFTEAGGVAVTLVRDGETMVMTVRDTGPGIAPEDQERIFAEFEQAEDGQERAHGGTGLGLAISRRIIAAMGGTLSVASKPGQGASFCARIPLTEAEGDFAAIPSLDGLRVLCLSPNPVEMASVGLRLRSRQAEVRRVEAVADIPAEAQWDVVLIDERLGDAALAQALDTLKGRAQRLVLVVTPTARKQIARWRKKGVNGWLVSPIREASLLAQVRCDGEAPSTVDPLTDDKPRKATAEPSRSLAILLAEDNAINALLATRLLEKLGHRVTHAEDGELALAMLNSATPFDLALIDVQMPKMSGHEVARAYRAGETDSHLPMIALTANAFVEDREAALAAGMDDFLTKPLQRERLAEIIERFLPAEAPRLAAAKKARRRS